MGLPSSSIFPSSEGLRTHVYKPYKSFALRCDMHFVRISLSKLCQCSWEKQKIFVAPQLWEAPMWESASSSKKKAAKLDLNRSHDQPNHFISSRWRVCNLSCKKTTLLQETSTSEYFRLVHSWYLLILRVPGFVASFFLDYLGPTNTHRKPAPAATEPPGQEEEGDTTHTDQHIAPSMA